jgi:small-conductance mechanosensitive channel
LLGGGKKNRRRRQGDGAKRLRSAVIVVLAALGAGWTAQWALSQQAPSGDLDSQVRTEGIVAHLNSVIQFYRATLVPIQKAGEPNDVVYRDQAVALSRQIAGLAFQSAKAEAALMAENHTDAGAAPGSAGAGEQQRIEAAEANAENQLADLHGRETALEQQMETAKAKDLPALQAQKKQIKGALDLSEAMKDALQKIAAMSGNAGGTTGLSANIDRLETSVPELQGKNKVVYPALTTVESARSSGVTSQGAVLLDLVQTRTALDALLKDNKQLHKQAVALRTPILTVLRGLIAQGQQMTQQAETAATPSCGPGQPPAAPVPAPAGPAQPSIGQITTQFKALSAVAVPLSQEIILLEQSRANLDAWQTSTNREYGSILHWLLLRICVIAIALAVIFGAGQIWSHVTNRYVKDIRRRRQFLLIRRTVVGFLSVIVLLFGFVTQFNSLATFAGFITAGIAVGLQTILLSVAAYFFIIGRYGVKVGDRITIATVTGDVIDVGLVRFYMMELAGSGTSLNPTGRVAVFSNAVLFQAGTPLYKQIPGTEYAWHELILKLNDGPDYKQVCSAVLKEVNAVFDGYRVRIEQQHRGVERQMQTSIDAPAVESRLQFNSGAFQLWVRFPVPIREASETDEKVTRAILDLIEKSPDLKKAVASTPVIQASVRG